MRALSRLSLPMLLAAIALTGCATVSLDSTSWPPLNQAQRAPVENRSLGGVAPLQPVPRLEDAEVVVSPVLDSALAREPESAAAPASAAASAPAAAAISPSWVGNYDGMLPCADCPGLRTLLSLYDNQTYILSIKREGGNDLPTIMRGNFTWNADHSVITLDQAGQGRRYRVTPGQALQLRNDGSPVTGVLASRYTLKQREE